jgi:PIN domain nuclease of toxin-antitoxin system
MTDSSRPRLLLDTHVWIWLINGRRDRAGVSTWQALDEAGAGNGMRLSTFSVWEAAMLDAKGRLLLSPDCRAWVARALRAPGLHLEPLTPAIAIASTRLPDFPHRDPVDRILVATARVTGAALVTRDRRILDYAARGYLRVLDATPNG